MPRVTVIVPTYNWSAVLPYSIGSVLDQTFTDFECLVVGDGCSDDSGQVVAALGDSRVVWHNLTSRAGHQASANNEGIRRAGGELIAYLGHDDLWLPHHLRTLVDAIDRGADIAHGMTLTVPPVGLPQLLPPRAWVFAPGDYVAPTSLVHVRWLAEAVGGWRHPRDSGTLEPEMHLLKLMAARAGPPQFERRLTCVKLPAAVRRDVYRRRPTHEQAYWLERIRRASDPEVALSAATDEPYVFATRRCTLAPHRRRRRRHTLPLRRALRRLGVPPTLISAERRWRRRRRYKGADGR